MRIFIVSVLTCFMLAAPVVAGAQEGGFVQCSGTECNVCHLVGMANTIINWLIRMLAVVAVLVFVVAGFRLVTSGGDPSAMQYFKARLLYIAIGFLLVLTSWLIVDAVLRGLTERGGLNMWGPVSCGGLNDPTLTDQGEPEFEPLDAFVEGNPGWTYGTTFSSVDQNGHSVAPAIYQCVDESDCSQRRRDCEAEGGTAEYDRNELVVQCSFPRPQTSAGSSGANCPAADPSDVATIPGTSYSARPEIVSNFIAMRDAAARDGITLRVTSGWRSEQRQVELWNELNGTGRAVARPCSLGGNGSNHNSGNAIDISVGCSNGQSGCSTPTYNWLRNNGGRYGFYNNLPSDPVHWSPSGR